jgi:hypothetical protein
MFVFAAVARELLFLVPALAAYGYLLHLHPELAAGLWQYGLFCLGFLFLPGYALSRLLLRTGAGFMERVCLGYPAAQGLLFLLAWGGSRAGLSWWATLALPALGLYAVWDLPRRRPEGNRSEVFVVLAAALSAAAALAIYCLGVDKIAPLPSAAAPAGFYCDDSLMTMGAFSALKAILSGQLFMDGRFGDIPATYHILLFVQNGVAHFFSGEHPLFLQLYLNPVLNLTMLAGGIAAGARRLAGFGKTQTALVAVLLLFTSGFDFTANVWLQTFFYTHTFSASLVSATLLGFVLYGVLRERAGRLPVAYAVLVFFAASAAKSVVLLLVPLALLPVLAYRALKRKLGRDDLFFSLGVLATGLLLRAIEYRSTGQLIIKKFNLFNTVMDLLIPGLELAPFALLLLALANRDRLASHKVGLHKQYLLFAGAMFVLAVALTRTIEFVGGGQYFYWYTRIYLLIGVAGALDWAFAKRMRPVLAAVAAVTAGAVLIFIVTIGSVIKNATPASTPDTTMDKGEWDGLVWAYDHLDTRARFICNRIQFVETRKGHDIYRPYYDYLAVSGMYGYAWISEWFDDATGREINARLKKVQAFWDAQTPEAQGLALRDIKADYLFVSKRQRPLDYTGVAGIHRVYANPSFDIYDIRGVAGARPESSGGL